MGFLYDFFDFYDLLTSVFLTGCKNKALRLPAVGYYLCVTFFCYAKDPEHTEYRPSIADGCAWFDPLLFRW
jgi:hypothetical protein